MLLELKVASPDYLACHDMPSSIEDLSGHMMIGFLSSLSGNLLALEFIDGGAVREVTLPTRVSANHSDTNADFVRREFSLARAPRHHSAGELAAGTLVEIVPDHPPLDHHHCPPFIPRTANYH